MYWESQIAIIAVGNMVVTADKVRKQLKQKGYKVTLINARFVKPFDSNIIFKCQIDHKLIVTMEENVLTGGFCEMVSQFVMEHDYDVHVQNITLPDEYIEHGSVDILKCEAGIDADTVTDRIASFYSEINID